MLATMAEPSLSKELHLRVRRGDLPGVMELLEREPAVDVDAYDLDGQTPLMYAVAGPRASLDIARALLEHGADPDRCCGPIAGDCDFDDEELDVPDDDIEVGAPDDTALSSALGAGNPAMIELLLEHGATLGYRRGGGYDALLDAAHSGNDERLLDLLRLLLDQGAKLDGVSVYDETACRVLSRMGRFDAVALLLDAGADPAQLDFSPLIRAVALGTIRDVERALDEGASLEDTDWWERSAWLVALQMGDLDKAKLLRERGADVTQRGNCGVPPVFYAIDSGRTEMLRWLHDIGVDLTGTDNFGNTALIHAVDRHDVAAVDALLALGADVNEAKGPDPWVEERMRKSGADPARLPPETALRSAYTAAVAKRLLDAGADPADLQFEARRALVGLEPDPDSSLLDNTSAEFLAGRTPRFGTDNPEKMEIPFWTAMIRAGVSAYHASERFDEVERVSPVWCAQRFGQSITFLPDGRIVQIAGEHEDYYDPDFCIYNDVFVHHPDGSIEIFGYPAATFPPTDSHTATLVGGHIYIIGSAGHSGARNDAGPPVYRLDTATFHIERVSVDGKGPGRDH